MSVLPLRDPPCDVMRPDCPARAVLALLAEKWSLLVIQALGEGVTRPSALRRRTGGISEKMLLQTLRRLIVMGLVDRRDFDEVPMRVEYSLTPLGWSLPPVVVALDRWVERHALDMRTPAEVASD